MNFKLGQRVRLVRPWENQRGIAIRIWEKLRYQEGTVVELNPIHRQRGIAIGVLFDHHFNTRSSEGVYCCPNYGLEPIVEGPANTATTWDECPWKPEHMREEVLEPVIVR